MKFLAVFIFALLAIESQATEHDELKTKLKTISEDCINLTGVNKDLILKARKREFVEDQTLGKYFHCCLHKVGIQDDDGTIHKDVMIQKLPSTIDHDKGTEIVHKCTKLDDGLSKEKAAYLIFKCFFESADKDFKFF